jgi:hypothetical protein
MTTVHVVNHDVPTDPDALKATRIEQADAAVASAKAKVERQQQHLKAAKEALAQATAARKELG